MTSKLEYSLIQLIEALGDEHHGGLAAQVLVQFSSTLIINLIQTLDNPQCDMRGKAAYVLGHIGGKINVIIPSLVPHLGDEDEIVCQQTANALSEIGKPTVEALIKALKDEDTEVRFHAATALADFVEPAVEAVDALIDALCDETCGVRWVAAEALQSIGTSEALDAIKLYKKHESERYQTSRLYNEED